MTETLEFSRYLDIGWHAVGEENNPYMCKEAVAVLAPNSPTWDRYTLTVDAYDFPGAESIDIKIGDNGEGFVALGPLGTKDFELCETVMEYLEKQGYIESEDCDTVITVFVSFDGGSDD